MWVIPVLFVIFFALFLNRKVRCVSCRRKVACFQTRCDKCRQKWGV